MIPAGWRDGLVVPVMAYLAVFFLMSPHLAEAFSTAFFFGGADGYQNIWNLWWVDRALADGANPWFTTLLHHPYGTTLVGHTLNPFNGMLAIVLLRFGTLVQTYNAIVIFSFVAGGVTTYWLCYHVTHARVASLAGGAVFTFSSFHFMHADGHLQLTALQWLPLFVLCWMRFCEAPTIARGLGAAAVLALVILCDLYYFTYAVFTAALFYAWMAWQRRDWMFLIRERGFAPLAAMIGVTMITCGLLVMALIVQHASDPFLGTHSPRALSMDLLSPFVWGYYWRFRDAVPLWKALSEYPTEASVHVGLAIMAVCAYAWSRRRALPVPHLGFWLCLAAFFFVMSLGTNLHVAGTEVRLGPPIRFMGRDDVNWLALPYAWLWVLFPPWRLAGVPVRMMVMVQLVAAVLASAGVRAMLAERRGWLLAAALVVTAIEYWPAPMRLTDPAVPAYVEELRDLPGGAVLDLASNAPLAMYYQTIHGKPIAFGYISRTPASVDAQDQELAALIRAGQWDTAASRFGFRYVVARDRAADVMVRGLSQVVLPPIATERRLSVSGNVAIYEF